MSTEKIEALKREIAGYEWSARDLKEWPHHRAHSSKRAAELRQELAALTGGETGTAA